MGSKVSPCYYAIREVSEMTGVKPVTLRAWQRRYNLVQPERTPKGHRLYTDDHIALIKEIQHWLSRGVAIGKVKPLLGTQEFNQQPVTRLDEVQDMVHALTQLKSQKAHAILSTVCKEYPLEIVKNQFFEPLVAAINALKFNVKSMASSCLVTLVAQQFSWMIDANNKAGAKRQCVLVSLESMDNLNAWLKALSLSESGAVVTALFGCQDFSKLLDIDGLSAVSVFSEHQLTSKQLDVIAQLKQQGIELEVNEVITSLHFDERDE